MANRNRDGHCWSMMMAEVVKDKEEVDSESMKNEWIAINRVEIRWISRILTITNEEGQPATMILNGKTYDIGQDDEWKL